MNFGLTLAALLAAPLFAQTQIGGGTCSSASLNTTYAVSITGRQVNSGGTFMSVVQGNGSATFDGLSKATITFTENTNQALGTPVTWSGTYSVQANCAATVTITSGGSATLNLVVYNQGKNFLLTGEDSTYDYAGSGITQPTGCSVATLNGSYTLNATGFVLNTNSIAGVEDGEGLLQFDGQGNLTVNLSAAASGAAASMISLTGPYTISSNCTGSATLSDSGSHSFTMSFSIYNVSATNVTFFATLAGASKFQMAGGGHTATTTACSSSTLKGTYPMTLDGRAISPAGAFAGTYQGIGIATFDGQGNVTLAGNVNTNLSQTNPFSYSGTYSVPANCDGTLTLTSGSTAAFTLLVSNAGAQFNLVGSDATYVYSGGGNSTQPFCATPTISGEYSYTASGFTLAGTTQNGAQDEAGILNFDGQGKVSGAYLTTQAGMAPVSNSVSGTYSVNANCSASATVQDSAGHATTLNFQITGPHGEALDLLAANSQFVRAGSAHSAFVNPSQGIGNVASYAYSATPAGSVFALFGENLAARTSTALTLPIPKQLLSTTVTVNGEAAPLFYVSTGQIDAQMPWDIPGNTVASVIVTNGNSVSNAAAVYVPATGTPGINEAGNRAPVVNANGTVNSAANGAKVGDEVAVYFTGGGPVDASGPLNSGAGSPSGLSPITGTYSVTVGGVQAHVVYIGLSPGSVGLYQANFDVPQLDKGTYPVVITIAGQASNNPVMTVSD